MPVVDGSGVVGAAGCSLPVPVSLPAGAEGVPVEEEGVVGEEEGAAGEAAPLPGVQPPPGQVHTS